VKVTCAGGASSIGASCTLLEIATSSLIIDCGIRPGERKSPLPDLSVLTGKKPSSIVLTHAHTDHSGALPVLAEYFPDVPILATPPTIELTGILFRDSLKIMNSPEREADIPLYNEIQVERVLENFVPIQFNESRTIDDFTITPYQAGHILGAAMFHIATHEGNVLISGDYSIGSQRTVGTAHKPSLSVDLLISEATYGERLHEERFAAETRFIEQVKDIFTREGKILVPSFAIGRAQEILLILKKALRDGRLPPIPVYVDGMVKSVCNVYSSYENYVTKALVHEIRSNRHPFWNELIKPVETASRRNEILQGGPCLIVASSGMLNGGASMFYATRLLNDERNAVLLTGYQDEESPGSALLNLTSTHVEAKNITLCGEEYAVKASVHTFGLSAHADRMEMAGFIDSLRPKTVLLVHGSNDARESLKKSLRCKDSINGFDGLVMERTFGVKNEVDTYDSLELPQESDLERIRAILGPPASLPVKGSRIADMWFGTRVKPQDIEKLICRLIDLGLVRRDDEKCNLLWILTPSESKNFPDEAKNAQRVKTENFKGKILEYCMKMNLAPPVTEWRIDGGFHCAKMILIIGGSQYQSNTQKAAERSVAEQLAAEELLAFCNSRDSSEIGDAIYVSEKDAEILKSANPKGKLLEYCTKNNLQLPQFQFRVLHTDWCCRTSLEKDLQQVISKWYQSKSKTTAQQAAAEEILNRFKNEYKCKDVKPGFVTDNLNCSPEISDNETRLSSTESNLTGKTDSSQNEKDSRLTLNVLKQRGYIVDFGYSAAEQEGPSHAPVFTVKAWVKLPDDSLIESSMEEGKTKKQAERNAARAVVELISNL